VVLAQYITIHTIVTTQDGNGDSNNEIDDDSNDDSNIDIDDNDDVGGSSSKTISATIASHMGKMCTITTALSHETGIRFADAVFA
jgi:hypothetical protein